MFSSGMRLLQLRVKKGQTLSLGKLMTRLQVTDVVWYCQTHLPMARRQSQRRDCQDHHQSE